MLGLFKKKSKLEKLNKQYQKLQQEAFKLSSINRKESDKKQAEAQAILEKIALLKKD